MGAVLVMAVVVAQMVSSASMRVISSAWQFLSRTLRNPQGDRHTSSRVLGILKGIPAGWSRGYIAGFYRILDMGIYGERERERERERGRERERERDIYIYTYVPV